MNLEGNATVLERNGCISRSTVNTFAFLMISAFCLQVVVIIFQQFKPELVGALHNDSWVDENAPFLAKCLQETQAALDDLSPKGSIDFHILSLIHKHS